jgi:biotin carboxyl carrier protein
MALTRYVGTHAGKTVAIELELASPGRYHVTLDGRSLTVDARQLEGQRWGLLLDGKSHEVELDVAGPRESEGSYKVQLDGHVIPVNVVDERKARLAQAKSKAAAQGPQVLESPMPGRVVKLLVGVGDPVAHDQPLVIVEAMKMENELRSKTQGKVTKIFVQEGQAVEARAKLVSVE